MKKTGIAGVILAACLSLLGAVPVYGETEGGQERAMEGVYIENINVSGMAEEEITNAIQGKIEELSQSQIEFYVGGSGVAVTAGDLGLNYTNDKIVRQALEVGQKGNVLQRFETTRTMEEKGPLVLELQYAVDGDKVRTVVEEQCVALNHSAVNMSLKRESNGSFTTVAGQDGASLKVEESIQTIQNFFSKEWRGGDAQITLDADVEVAQGDAEQLALVKDVLGESSTDYSSSSANRRTNIVTGTSKLNGKVLYPGEEISVLEMVKPFDEENGYATAPSYEMGSVVDSYGGGICQVSTTLYLAVLRAELDVTERSNHSMIVNYVKPSMDAAIADGSKDFKFKNNTDAPIYILGYASSGEIGFVIYGHETRDRENRKVSFESETLNTTEADNKIKADSELEFGSKESSSGHTGKEAKLWKIITVNGEETKEQVNSSNYQMSPNLTRVGTKGGDSQAVQALQDAISTNDMSKVNEVISQYPGGKSSSSSGDSGEE